MSKTEKNNEKISIKIIFLEELDELFNSFKTPFNDLVKDSEPPTNEPEYKVDGLLSKLMDIPEELKSKLTKNKLTEQDIEEVIEHERYIKLGQKTTICLLTLKNGFEVVGKSGCVDPKNYDHEIGCRIARQKAIDQVWLLEGYLLQDKLNN